VGVEEVAVDVGAVVGDEDAARGAVGLGIDEPVLPLGGGEEGSLGLNAVLVGDARGEVGGEELLSVGARG